MKQTIRHFLGALHFVWLSSKYWTITKLILLIIQSILPLASLYLLKLVVDEVTNSIQAATTPDFAPVLWLIALWGGVNLITVFAATVNQYVNENQSLLVSNYMADIVHEKSAALELAYYENPKYLNTLHRAQLESKSRPNQILNSLTSLIQNGISLVAIGGLLIYLHWGAAVLLILAALPALVVRLKFSEKRYVWARKRTQLKRESNYLGYLLTFAEYAKEVRLFRLGTYFKNKFSVIQKQLFKESKQIAFNQAWISLIAKGSEVIAIFAAYIFIAYRTVGGELTIGDLVMYYQAFQRGQAFLQSALTSLSSLYENKLFLQNLFEFLDLKPAYTSKGSLPVPDLTKHSIRFDEVAFSYTPEGKKVLHEIQLEAKNNEVISLVGKNGAGKTTLIKLLCRLYEPTAGAIWIGDTNIQDIEVGALRKQVSVIFQDFIQYRRTAKENIALGDVAHEVDMERLKEAARLTGAAEIIEKLPKQYDSMLGRLFTKGEELSIGQWQKVALARAFYSKAKIIVLDEPTSAMDALAEYEFFKKLKAIAQDKIIFLISHRLSSATMSDRIYFIEDGRIAESGSHEELIQLNGKYAFLFNKQAQLYRES
ncbi:MAG: ABC transporter ATP-binding protein [Flammeovirgaceae bacterium]